MCDNICYEMFRLQQALKPSKEDTRFLVADIENIGLRPVNSNTEETGQIKLSSEQEACQPDWVGKN